MKKHLAEEIGIDFLSIDIVCISDGIIYENTRSIDGIPTPLEVMVGNPNRKISPDLVTPKPDVIVPSETEPRIEMSCGHAISKKKIKRLISYREWSINIDTILNDNDSFKQLYII